MRDRPDTREIAVRLLVTGTLRLLTPAHIGNGDAEGLTDMPLLQDAIENRPLLTGSTIAGALRAYLQTATAGNGVVETASSALTQLFGGFKGDALGDQSALIVDDALGTLPKERPQHEVRDGVRIDYDEHTASDKAKYDLELLPAGTSFDLRFELLLRDAPAQQTQLCALFAHALSGFSPTDDGSAAICLGARRSRGFGRCAVDTWTVTRYNLKQRAGLLAWLSQEYPAWGYPPPQPRQGGPEILLPPQETIPQSVAASTSITADFALAGPVLIRSTDMLMLKNGETASTQPDVTHLHSYRIDHAVPVPVISGTSLAGVLRSRASRILASMPAITIQSSTVLLNDLFGTDMLQHDILPTASRLVVDEVQIQSGKMFIQNRISIDRFTGGALDTALFNEAPVLGSAVTVQLHIRHLAQDSVQRRQAHIGMLLLLLKDLWTADLPVGGGSAVGRGRLQGQKATITTPDSKPWILTAQKQAPYLHIEGPEGTVGLQKFVTALYEELRHHE